ncbi:polysaccharide deacetylase family protein [Vitiosangium sp. GDMCC 1.1324]|uniref:polysaccharide deacetylase family protein n=1 Tax=Vitiosangium sp. (strain GDMCC 1.1324) TaxID=2138576 RepID=UPI00130EC905|nr:polysaccharide deacetylase family protein [Vitiosangium sp. GDMCC 1.1324]
MKEAHTHVPVAGNERLELKRQRNQLDLRLPRNPIDLDRLVLRARSLTERRWTYRMKQGVKALSFYLGLHPASWKLGAGEAAVLFYHKVERRPLDVWGEPVLDVHEFERHVAYLAREYRPVSMSELIAGLRGQTRLPHRAVVLTFDDGYRNNLYLVAPILARYGVPAMLFVTTGLIGGNQWMWAYELEELFSRFAPEEIRQACGDPVVARLCALGLEPRALMMACVEHLKDLPHPVMLALVERLRSAFPLPVNDENRFLSWNEVRELRRQGFEIGAHTETHPILTRLPLEEVERELLACRDTLEAELGIRPTVFSYPNGATNPEVSALVGRYFEAAVTTRTGFCSRAHALLELPRIGAPVHVSELAFELAWNYFRLEGARPGLWAPRE